MNKKEFVGALSTRVGMSKTVCRKMLEETIKIIKESFYTGTEISIKNFGKFGYKEIAERRRYLPALKMCKTEKPKVIPKFTPSRDFYGKIL